MALSLTQLFQIWLAIALLYQIPVDGCDLPVAIAIAKSLMGVTVDAADIRVIRDSFKPLAFELLTFNYDVEQAESLFQCCIAIGSINDEVITVSSGLGGGFADAGTRNLSVGLFLGARLEHMHEDARRPRVARHEHTRSEEESRVPGHTADYMRSV